VAYALRVGVVIYREDKLFVVVEPTTGVASQGKSFEEALKNFDEAFELWLENAEPWEKERLTKSEAVASIILEHKIS